MPRVTGAGGASVGSDAGSGYDAYARLVARHIVRHIPGNPAVDFEHGVAPTEAVSRRLIELERLVAALSEVMKKEFVGNWLRTPNPAFAGLKPAEVIERGEADRLWELIYLLRSGIAY